MGMSKITSEVWDKLTSGEKKEFTELLKKQYDNIELTSKQVAVKVNLPYTVVSEEMVDEYGDTIVFIDKVMKSIAEKFKDNSISVPIDLNVDTSTGFINLRTRTERAKLLPALTNGQ